MLTMRTSMMTSHLQYRTKDRDGDCIILGIHDLHILVWVLKKSPR